MDTTIQDMMMQGPSIPADPVGPPEKLRSDLIDQILEFQTRYNFIGVVHTRETLERTNNKRLERLCDMMLMAIANSFVRDKYTGGTHS